MASKNKCCLFTFINLTLKALIINNEHFLTKVVMIVIVQLVVIVQCFHCLLVYCLSKLDSVIYKNPSRFQWNAVALWAWGKFKSIIIIEKLLLSQTIIKF